MGWSRVRKDGVGWSRVGLGDVGKIPLILIFLINALLNVNTGNYRWNGTI